MANGINQGQTGQTQLDMETPPLNNRIHSDVKEYSNKKETDSAKKSRTLGKRKKVFDDKLEKKIMKDSSLSEDEDIEENQEEPECQKKDKKLVFLSKSVLDKLRERPMITGTSIAQEILELYRQISENVDFKNVQRRVYDALNVLCALEVVKKESNLIVFNENHPLIPYIDSATNNTDQKQSMVRKKLIADKQQAIEDKKKIFLEQVKQFITLNKLVQRNHVNSQLEMKNNSIKSHADVTDRKLSLPLLLIKVNENSRTRMDMDDSKQTLHFKSDKMFVMMNENHVLEQVGLTKCNEDDVHQFLPENIRDYLATQMMDNEVEEELSDDDKVGSTESPMIKTINKTKAVRQTNGFSLSQEIPIPCSLPDSSIQMPSSFPDSINGLLKLQKPIVNLASSGPSFMKNLSDIQGSQKSSINENMNPFKNLSSPYKMISSQQDAQIANNFQQPYEFSIFNYGGGQGSATPSPFPMADSQGFIEDSTKLGEVDLAKIGLNKKIQQDPQGFMNRLNS